MALLALVAGQDVEPAEGSDGRDGRWRIARKVAPDRVISTVDEQARHTRKSPSNRRDGYRAHLVAEPETGLITDEALTMAAGADNADAAVAQTFLADTDTGATPPPHCRTPRPALRPRRPREATTAGHRDGRGQAAAAAEAAAPAARARGGCRPACSATASAIGRGAGSRTRPARRCAGTATRPTAPVTCGVRSSGPGTRP